MAQKTERRATAKLLVDCHVHIHEAFSEEGFLGAAARNLHEAMGSIEANDEFIGALMLTECAGVDRFGNLRQRRDDDGAEWRVQPTAEEHSIVAQRGPDTLIVVAGRQIVTRERLEVLALATPETFADGRTVSETLEQIQAAGAIPVLPWGWGKWLGKRGTRVKRILDTASPHELFVADNGGRARGTPEPVLFRAARRRGISVLAGSDPLPLPGEVDRVGSYGIALDCEIDGRRPGSAIGQAIRGLTDSPPTFGRLLPLGKAVRAQIRLRMR